MEDHALIELYWNRDEAAIAQTAQKYGGYCNQIAYNILGNPQDSEECVSDTYLKAWNAIPQDRPGLFRAYLGRITRNLAINRYHLLRAQKRGGGQLELILEELEGCIPAPATVEDEAESNRTAQVINQFLANLNPELRVVFIRRYWYADSIAAIAKRLGYGENKVKSILFRCRNRLKLQLEQEGITL